MIYIKFFGKIRAIIKFIYLDFTYMSFLIHFIFFFKFWITDISI